MFTPDERASLRSDLLEFARQDARITAGAVTGSAAADREDEWSDIDLAFGVAGADDLPNVLADWTARMYDRHSAVHHFDVKSGAWTYRVFLMPSTLQVDLAFVAAAEFRALAPTFCLVFGQANQARHTPPQQTDDLIGMGLLYALHARSSIARHRLWQAEFMISSLRDTALALACLRHGLPAAHARGFDQLPSGVARQFKDSLIGDLGPGELARAFQVATEGFLGEIRIVDRPLAARLEAIMTSLIAKV